MKILQLCRNIDSKASGPPKSTSSRLVRHLMRDRLPAIAFPQVMLNIYFLPIGGDEYILFTKYLSGYHSQNNLLFHSLM